MKHFFLLFSTFIIFNAFSQNNSSSLVNTSQSPYALLQPVNMGDVRFTEGFWADRFDVCNHTMSPELMRTYMNANVSHSFENFRIAAGLTDGKHSGPPFHDGDLYKVFESMVSLYAVTRDATLNKLMDSIVTVIAASQRADGYIHSPVTIDERRNADKERAFGDRLNFETYNMGHLMTAACLHFRATGKKTLLNVAIKATDFLYNFYQTASPELARNAICPSHYMGVVEMYRTTRDPKYFELSKSLIDIRGLMENGTDDNQDRVPFRQQTKAMGHAVRANYLYAGVADVYAETGDTSLLRPLNLIWENMTKTKMYITGACGAMYDGVSPDGVLYEPPLIQKTHQSYGRDYQLPNKTAHNETCANIGNLLWNWRMFLISGEAKYMDIVELTLYNSILSGVSLDGHDFCYTNPLSVSDDFPYKLRWSGGRIPYIALSNCCPPNTTRTLAQVQDYAYTTSEKGVWVNLYGGNELKTTNKRGEKIEITQTTDYPWNGKIFIEVKKMPKGVSSVYLRIPEWCNNATVLVNGNESIKLPNSKEEQMLVCKAGEYCKIERTWKAGDKIELEIPMDVKLIETNPLVEETRNQVAVKRGPVVYCIESNDLPDESIFNVSLPADIQFVPKHVHIGDAHLFALEGKAKTTVKNDWSNTLYREVSPADKDITVRLIPYFAWGNRGKSEMTVWMNLKK
jgi:Uncharacterized protein conserved in bacteria